MDCVSWQGKIRRKSGVYKLVYEHFEPDFNADRGHKILMINRHKNKMGKPKLRIVFFEDKEKNIQSYFHLEKSEALRVIEILKLLPKLTDWTPAVKVAEMINAKLPATLWTIQKLAGALWLDIKLDDEIKVLAKKPILYVKKNQNNSRNNLSEKKFFCSPVYIKLPYSNGIKGT